MKLAILICTAMSSDFPNLPSYLSSKDKIPRSSNTSADRRENEILKYEEDVNGYFQDDQVDNLSSLFENLQTYERTCRLTFFQLDVISLKIKIVQHV